MQELKTRTQQPKASTSDQPLLMCRYSQRRAIRLQVAVNRLYGSATAAEKFAKGQGNLKGLWLTNAQILCSHARLRTPL